MKKIKKYLIIWLVIITLLVFIIGISAFVCSIPIEEKANDTNLNNKSSNEGGPAGEVNNTNQTQAGSLAIPLERPPFID